MEAIFTIEGIIAFLTLCALEIVLGIDNIIFISIICDKLPPSQRATTRTLGLSLAVIMRIGLLLSLSWIIGLTQPLFTFMGKTISGRDLIFLLGGLFLIAKSTYEIHHKVEDSDGPFELKKHSQFSIVLIQILLLDIVFSLDSVITAVGMVNDIPIMVGAILVATAIMILAAGTIADFVSRHPTLKMLALSFLVLIGVTLLAEGLGQHISKGYIYFAMAFSLAVEMLNIRLRKKTDHHLTKKNDEQLEAK
jgi:predicted tellurium resistance membrane protein TerC